MNKTTPTADEIGRWCLNEPVLKVFFYTCADAFLDTKTKPDPLVISSCLVKAGLDIPEFGEPVIKLIQFVCGSNDKRVLLTKESFTVFGNADWVGVLEYVLKN